VWLCLCVNCHAGGAGEPSAVTSFAVAAFSGRRLDTPLKMMSMKSASGTANSKSTGALQTSMHTDAKGASGSPGSSVRRRKWRPSSIPPNEWQKGWIAHPAYADSGPRWTMRGPRIDSEDRSRPAAGSHRDRNTWIQQLAGEKTWVPGPGAYRSEREFVQFPKEEVDHNRRLKNKAPDYSFSKEGVKGDAKRIVDPSTADFTPGPGRYMQFTQFGQPSGGSRKAYFGGAPVDSFGSVQDLRQSLAQVPPRPSTMDR